MHVKTKTYQSGDVDTMKKNHRRSGKKKDKFDPSDNHNFLISTLSN